MSYFSVLYIRNRKKIIFDIKRLRPIGTAIDTPFCTRAHIQGETRRRIEAREGDGEGKKVILKCDHQRRRAFNYYSIIMRVRMCTEISSDAQSNTGPRPGNRSEYYEEEGRGGEGGSSCMCGK